MLSTEEQKEIDEEVKHNASKQGTCIEAMKIIQHHRGWVSDESIREIAEHLEMSPDQLDGVATFYNLIFRRPVGNHVIYLCDSVSCWIKGCDTIKQHLTANLGIDFGETTEDKQFTLLPIQCLGTCDHAPAMMIDGALFRDLTTSLVDNVLKVYQSHK
jgi:NADH-quinone oxidoreductase subunit E